MGKSSGFVPPGVSDETTNGAVPVLVIFTTRPEVALPSATDPHPIAVGVTLIQGVGVPMRVTTFGMADAPLGMVSDPLCAPALVVGAYTPR